MGDTVTFGDASKFGPRVPRILLVEDQKDARASCARYLRSEGFDVREASDVAGALALADVYPFDALVLDVRLGTEDGVSLLRELRTRRNAAGVPAIAWTAHAMPHEVSDLLASGFHYCLVKPAGSLELPHALRALIG